MTSQTTITKLDIGEVETVLDRVEQELGAETVRPLWLLLAWCLSIHAQLQQKNASIARLRRMLFGPRTEKTRDVVPKSDTQQTSEEHSTATPSAPDSMPPPSTNEPPKRKRPKKGHGGIPASAYTGCERVMITHETLCPEDSCPHCQDGTMYRQAEWAMAIRLTGQAPHRRSAVRAGLLPAGLPDRCGCQAISLDA